MVLRVKKLKVGIYAVYFLLLVPHSRIHAYWLDSLLVPDPISQGGAPPEEKGGEASFS